MIATPTLKCPIRKSYPMDQRNNYTVARAKSDALLTGRIYRDRGNRMNAEPCAQGWDQVSLLPLFISPPRDSPGVPDRVPGAGGRGRGSRRVSPSASLSRIPQKVITETSSAITSSVLRSKQTNW